MSRPNILLIATLVAGSLASLSAHVVRGIAFPTLAVAFVSSPSATEDATIKIMWGPQDTGLRVACFNTANTSPPSADPQWPRITAIGFELPGMLSGFSLMAPLDGAWELIEGANAVLSGRGGVTADFALVARPTGAGAVPGALPGIPPGQQAARGSGTRFCISGPFPEGLTIEQIINGVLVRVEQPHPQGTATDIGIWDNPLRIVPLYPQ
jgi:hypothetical protein